MTAPREYGLGVKFTADENSLERIALGGRVNPDKFTDPKFTVDGRKVIPAGTAVKRDTDNTLIPAAGGESAGTVFLMASDVVVGGDIKRGSDLTTGLYAGGVYYEDRLPDAQDGTLPANLKTCLGPKFTFQKSQGSLVVKE